MSLSTSSISLSIKVHIPMKRTGSEMARLERGSAVLVAVGKKTERNISNVVSGRVRRRRSATVLMIIPGYRATEAEQGISSCGNRKLIGRGAPLVWRLRKEAIEEWNFLVWAQRRSSRRGGLGLMDSVGMGYEGVNSLLSVDGRGLGPVAGPEHKEWRDRGVASVRSPKGDA